MYATHKSWENDIWTVGVNGVGGGEYTLSNRGIRTKTLGPSRDIFPGIRTGACEFDFAFETFDEARNIAEQMVTAIEGSVWISVSVNGYPYFSGPVLMDAVSLENFSGTVFLTITAVDGLAMLKDVRYTNPGGNPFNQDLNKWDTFLQHVANIMRLHPMYSNWFAGFTVLTDWWEENMKNVGSKCPWEESRFNYHPFSGRDKDGLLTEADISTCWEVLEQIAYVWAMRINYSNGTIAFENTVARDAGKAFWKFDKDGNLQFQNNYPPPSIIDENCDQPNLAPKAGGRFNFTSGFRAITYKYDYEEQLNLLQAVKWSSSDQTEKCLGGFLYDDATIALALAGEMEISMEFDFDNAGLDPWLGLYPIWQVEIELENVTTGNFAYWMNKWVGLTPTIPEPTGADRPVEQILYFNGSNWSNTRTPPDPEVRPYIFGWKGLSSLSALNFEIYSDLGGELPEEVTITGIQDYTDLMNFNELTPEIANLTGFANNGDILSVCITMRELMQIDYEGNAYSNPGVTFSWQFKNGILNLINGDTSTVLKKAFHYIATNQNTGGTSKTFNVKLGDGPPGALGRIQVLNSDDEWQDSSSWGIDGVGGLNILQLAAKSVAQLGQSAITFYSGALIRPAGSSYLTQIAQNSWSSYKYDGKTWYINTSEMNSWNDEYTVEMFALPPPGDVTTEPAKITLYQHLRRPKWDRFQSKARGGAFNIEPEIDWDVSGSNYTITNSRDLPDIDLFPVAADRDYYVRKKVWVFMNGTKVQYDHDNTLGTASGSTWYLVGGDVRTIYFHEDVELDTLEVFIF